MRRSVDPERVAVIVPMRGGSRRLPGKHARQLAGSTLPERTAAMLARAGLGHRVWLTTDDAALAETGKELGWHVPMLRPARLASAESPTIDAVLHVLDHMIDVEPDVVVLAQTTSPFCPPEAARAALVMLDRQSWANSVLAVHRLRLPARHLYRHHVPSGLQRLSVDQSADDAVFAPAGALYAVRSRALRHTRSLVAPPILPLELDAVAAVDIDTPEDWSLAVSIAESGLTGRCLADPATGAERTCSS